MLAIEAPAVKTTAPVVVIKLTSRPSQATPVIAPTPTVPVIFIVGIIVKAIEAAEAIVNVVLLIPVILILLIIFLISILIKILNHN